jgi:hypothetical protein
MQAQPLGGADEQGWIPYNKKLGIISIQDPKTI